MISDKILFAIRILYDIDINFVTCKLHLFLAWRFITTMGIYKNDDLYHRQKDNEMLLSDTDVMKK